MILVDGRVLYDGAPKDISEFLKEHGFDIPRGMPPLEYFLEIIDIGSVRI